MSEALVLQTCAQSASPGCSAAILQHQRERLGVFALVAVCGIVVFQGLMHLIVYGFGAAAPPQMALGRGIGLGLLCISLAVYGLTKTAAWPPCRTPLLALSYELVGALMLALPAYWGDHLLQGDLSRLHWVGMWLTLFPLVVPLPPRLSIAGSILGASACPLVFFTWAATWGVPLPEANTVLSTFAPVYIAAGLALIPAMLIHSVNTRMAVAEDQVRSYGSYRLIERLGEGGMGEVWRGEHRFLARPAAIKLISRSYLDEEAQAPDGEDLVSTALARFEREAQTTAALRSPHTIALYDFGTAADGGLYYVMELLEGTDLESLVARFGPVSPARAVHLLRQACCSLAEAHATGLIHRDIKPANIYTCKLGITYDFVKVLDFGLVRLPEREQGQAVRLTAEGYIVGTPAYVAPEMALEDGVVDGRADIYALGCVAYFLLTGALVFEEESAIAMVVAHARHTPLPPSRRARQPIPPALEQIVMACLEKDPARRPQSADALAELLANCELPATWTSIHARRWWLANRPHLPSGVEAPEPDPLHAETATLAMPAPAETHARL